ncbi:hypothetical protein [Frankia sp. Cr2]|uniref:hypothetical protein n=1 Tax=Frankia sp. Cr2 TaxID=3073932 RepID=UPI002AD45A78|nr:hypothetical protein [Frankia sp. Cr2]
MTALLAGLLSGIWIVFQLLVDVAFIAYLVHLRQTARADQRLRVSRLALDRRIAAERVARYGHRTAHPGAADSVAGPWASDSEPFRLSDSVVVRRGPGLGAEPGSGADLGVATAETVDLSQIAAAAAAGSGGRQPRVVDGTVVDGTVLNGTVVDGTVVDGQGADGLLGNATVTEGFVPIAVGATDDSANAAYADAEYAGAIEDESRPDAEQGSGEGMGSPGGGRATGRPGARPNTSKPGRVQVNPPGTHGGLTAGPAPAAGSQQPEAEAGAATGVATGDPDELDELLRRHAVGS